jgi:transposase InsO family protein
MPWKTSSLLEARERFVRTALRGCKSVAQLCREARISRKTGFKWLRRFRTSGGPGLRNRSRRPKHSPHCTASRWLAAIRALRRKHSSWGGKKIYARLRQKHPRARLPKPRTITDWLRRFGGKRPRRNKARPGPERTRPTGTIPRTANEVWTVDFKGWFRTRDGQRVNPLTVRDLFSRFILGIRLLPLEHAPVQRCFQALLVRYGQPKVIRVDHGSPFAGVGPLDLSRLSAWWLRLGIQVEFTRRACPQDNGAHEQMHRIYKADTATPPAATSQAQQRRSTSWTRYYNQQRPHEALGQRMPARLYHKSRRRYRGPLPPLRYPRHWRIRRVSSRGFIHWRGRPRGIGRAFSGENIGLKPLEQGVHEVYFERHLIGRLVDTDPGAMRPARWAKTTARTKHP